MKYFTKAWYELCQKTSFHLGLDEEVRAGTFSEDYFQQLYISELNSWLNLQEEIASLMMSNKLVDSIANYNCEPFNRDKTIEQFHAQFNFNQEYLKTGQ